MPDLVERVVGDFNREVTDRGYEVRLDIAPDLPAVFGDPDMLSRALWNLLDNAAKYSPECKLISIGVSVHQTDVRISVRDRGLGIVQNEMEAIFAKFIRGESARITGASRSGLGLSMVREIVEAHRGSVAVESTLGSGSTFTLTLPAEVGS